MCYNISSTIHDPELLEKALGPAYPAILGPLKSLYSVSGFSHPEWPVVSMNNPKEFQLLRWGLIPSWTPNPDLAQQFSNNNLNAKSETIFEKRSFKVPIKVQRCLIPVTGFFEWREYHQKKYPYHIQLKEEEIFCLGGISDQWTDRISGEIFNTFSIITTAANPFMEKIHNRKKRMPLILPHETAKDWLIPELKEPDIMEMMKPLDERRMTAHTISRRITSRTQDPNVPDTLLPFHYQELPPLS